MAIPTFIKWGIARLALLVLTFLPAVVISFCTCCMTRSRGDPARAWTKYLKVVFALFVLYLLFSIIAQSLLIAAYLLQYNDPYAIEYDKVYRDLAVAGREFSAVGGLFGNLAEICLVPLFVFLGIGIERVLQGQDPGKYRLFKPAAFATSILLSVLAVASWGIRVRIDLDGPIRYNLFNTSARLEFAISVLLLVLSLVVVGLSVVVTIASSSAKRCQSAAASMLACSVLWLLGRCFLVGAAIKYTDFSDVFDSPSIDNYIAVVGVILSIWPILVLLVIMFALSQKRTSGVWSTEQPPPAFNPGMVPHQPYQGQQVYYYQYGYQQPPTHYEVAQFGARSPPPQHVEVIGSAQAPPTELEQPYYRKTEISS